jgi:hypothetical protein
MKRIAVISGGAIKGYIQSQLLKKMESDLGMPLWKHYDLIAGSSVGAINGSMIASGRILMDRLEYIYPNMVKQIFKKSWFPFAVPMYDRKNFINVVNDEIGMIRMKDCLTKLQITSINLCDKRNHFFKSWEDGESFLWPIVCKSFAAPLFFGALADEQEQSVWIDGGMGIANLPIMYAMIEAMCLWPNEEYFFDIMGCGYVNQDIPYKTAKSFQFIRQLGQFFDLGDGGLAREQVRQEQIGSIQKLAQCAKNIHYNYWDIEIEKKYDKFDGVEFLGKYKEYGIEMAKKPLLVG